MSLQFVLGPAGSGKSYYMERQTAIWAEENPDRHYFVIVPEQFNLQTQRNLVLHSRNLGILNIDVVSFPRLADYVFEETGTDPGEVLTETGKNLILRRVAEEVREQLHMFGGRIDRQGFIAQVKSILSEFAQYAIDEDSLTEMIALTRNRPQLCGKLQDIDILQKAFDRYREERFITSEELLQVLARAVPKSKLLKGAVMVFDGFTGFTPVQMVLMEQLLQVTDLCMIALDTEHDGMLPAPSAQHDLFHMSAKTVFGLSSLAKRLHVPIEESVICKSTGYRFTGGSGLDYLERNLLRYHPTEPYRKMAEDIQIFRAPSAMQEVEYAADMIWKLTREENYHYRDIAVIVSDMPSYKNHIERVMERFDFPYFLDQKDAVLENPCLEMIRAAENMVEERYSYESVFRFLRCGFCSLTDEEIDLMENYVLAAGVRGKKRWLSPWTRSPKTFTEDEKERAEQLRQKFTDQISSFIEGFSHTKDRVLTYTGAVRGLLTELHAREHMEELYEMTQEMKEQTPALRSYLRSTGRLWMMKMEYEQIDEIIEKILEELEQLLGNEQVTREEFIRILDAGFEEAKVGSIPGGLDQIHIGDMIRTRLPQIRVLIFLGANDSFIPSREGNGGILSQSDRQFLSDGAVELAPDARENGFIQRFYLYQCLTKPSDRLIMGFSASDSAGRSMRPSYLILQMRKMFPKIQIAEPFARRENITGRIRTTQDIARISAAMLRDTAVDGSVSGELRELIRCMGSDPEMARVWDLQRRAVLWENRPLSISAERAQQLYEQPVLLSVSKLETFAQCPFRFFAQYGLKLSERERLQIEASDTGNFMHEVMKDYVERINAEGRERWTTITEEEEREVLDRCIDAVIKQDAGGRMLYRDNARNQYMITRLRRALSRSVWALTKQIRGGEMTPVGLEIPFRGEVKTLPSGARVRLIGRIDRIDLYENEDQLYLKVIDYKSGERSIRLGDLVYGQQLQLVEYMAQAMMALQHRGKEVIPAAMFYSHLTDPVPSAEDTGTGILDDSADKEQFLYAMRPDGMLDHDPEVMALMDREEASAGKSAYIPVSYNKNGTLRADCIGTRAISGADFQALLGYTEKKIDDFERRITEGEISIAPMQESSAYNACTYCDYRKICGFDPKLPGCDYRSMKKMDKDEAWQMIREGSNQEKPGEDIDEVDK